MLALTYEYKLIPTQQQVLEIENILTVCRKVWNFALRERKDWVNSRKCRIDACSLKREYIIPVDVPFPNYHIQAKNLTEAKRVIPELANVNAQVLQQVLRTLDRAWDDIWKRGFGFPRFKKLFRMRSFVFPQLKGEVVKKNRVKLPQLGWVKFRISRPIPDGFKVCRARVVRRASGYFVMLSLQLDVNVPEVCFSGHPLGVDIGLESFLATSDSELVARPKFFNSLHRKLELLQRRLKHKKLGSNNRRKLNQKIARLYQQISDTREDFHWKLAHHLCDKAGAIFVEEIDFRAWTKGMFRKHTFLSSSAKNKNLTVNQDLSSPISKPNTRSDFYFQASSDASFGQFFNILLYVCWKRGVFFARVSKDYTSQICPECGTHTGKKDLSERIHCCDNCGYTTNRDVAAAQVIRNHGILAVGQPVGLEIASGGLLAGASV